MGQITNLQTTAAEFLDAAEIMLSSGDFAEAESAVSACLKLIPGDKRALAMLDRIKRKDAVDIRGEQNAIIENVSSEISGPFTSGSGARHGRLLPHEVPDDGKEEAISLARRYEADENWVSAASAWESVLKSDPSDTWAWTQYAHLLSVNLKDYKKAEEMYRKALDVDPTDDWAWGKLGIMLADFSGRVSQGQDMLRRAIDLDSNEAYYKAWLGWSLFYQSEEVEEAVGYLQAAVAMLPSYQWAWFHLAHILSTIPGKHKESRKAYQTSLKLSPNDISSNFNLAIVYQEIFLQPKQALKYFKKVVTLNPDDSAGWRRIAFLQRDQFGDSAKAIEAFTKTVSLNSDDFEAWTILGHLLWEEEKDMVGSLNAINQALRLEPESPWIWCHLGDYYCFGTRDIGSAEVSYRKALELNDKFDWALSHLGSLLLGHKNEAEEAEGYLQKAVDISPKYIFALRELINCKRALSRSDDEIIVLYDKILVAEPDSIDIIIEYAETLGENLGQPEKGFSMLQEAIKEAPDHYYLQWSILHYSIYTLGRVHEAAMVIPALEELGQEEMSVACLLGFYYAQAEGDFDRAAAWYGQAIELAPDDHFAMHEYGVFLLKHLKDFNLSTEVLSQAALLDNDYCIGLEGDMTLARISSDQCIKDSEQGLAWVDKVLDQQAMQLEDLHTALLLLVAYGDKAAALSVAETMIASFPVSSRAWVCYLACLILTDASDQEVSAAREKAIAYKAKCLNLDEALEEVIKPLGLDMTGG